jgi:hypothetical protein
MPNIRAFRSGNWSDTTSSSPWWNGTAIFAPQDTDIVFLNGFTVNVDSSQNIGSGVVTNATSNTVVFSDGGTASTTAAGQLTAANGVTLTANLRANTTVLTISGTNSCTIIGSLTQVNNAGVVIHSSSGTLTLTGNIIATNNAAPLVVSGSGTAFITGNVSASATATNGAGISITGPANVSVTGTVVGSNGFTPAGILTSAAGGSLTITGDINAGATAAAVNILNPLLTLTVTGNQTSSAAGWLPVQAARMLVSPTPTAARVRFARNTTGSYSDFFTADNNLGQASPSDVRLGTSYASGALIGTLAVPPAGSVALGVPVGATTGTAVLTMQAVQNAVIPLV